MTGIRKIIERLWSETEGSATIELMLVAPIFIGLTVGVWDLGRLAAENASLTSAASAGAQFGMKFPDDPALIIQAVRDDYGVGGNLLTVTVATTCECPEAPVEVLCTDTCLVFAEPATFLTLQVQGTFTTANTYPSLTNPVSITKRVVIRTN